MIRDKILQYIQDKNYKGETLEELMNSFSLEKSDYKIFSQLLGDLEREGYIRYSKKGKYLPETDEGKVRCKIATKSGGFAFAIPCEGEEKDFFIGPDNLRGAMNGDEVLVREIRPAQGDRNAEGVVDRILSQPPEEIIGNLQRLDGFGMVVPDDPSYFNDIYIPRKALGNYKNRDKVVVKVVKRSRDGKNPEGVVTEKLGSPGDRGLEITSVARQHGLPFAFPKEVLEESKKIPSEVSQEDLVGRTDFTGLLTVTIDGADAKDFDDAISIAKTEKGYRLYVHIADVSHYVKEHSAIDKEALHRGNSVYLLDRVIPMLPENISNGICSLQPGVTRLTHTVEMELDKKGELLEYGFYRSYIVSDHRLIYEDVSDYLEGGKAYNDESLNRDLKYMEELYHILLNHRLERGAITFDLPETSYTFDENGKVVDVQPLDRRVSNSIIEEFMVRTNEVVSEHFGHMEYPFLYRVHEPPTEEKVKAFGLVLHNLGYRLRGQGNHPREYQNVLAELRGKPEERLVTNLLLRAMSKAKYSSFHSGHFGLASTFYSHFTAPIRRYSDLVIHRFFAQQVEGKLKYKFSDSQLDRLEETAYHVSVTERKAEEAERAVEKILKASYMKDHIGEVFKGVVSGLTDFGIFVELENTVEGLVAFRNLEDDYYNFNKENYFVKGERTGRVVKLGQNVQVRVIGVDDERHEVDMKIEKW